MDQPHSFPIQQKEDLHVDFKFTWEDIDLLAQFSNLLVDDQSFYFFQWETEP